MTSEDKHGKYFISFSSLIFITYDNHDHHHHHDHHHSAPELSHLVPLFLTSIVLLTPTGGQIEGDVCQRLVPQGVAKPSLATFTSVSIKPGEISFRSSTLP